MAVLPSAGIEHFHARAEENRLAQSLDEGFDITSGGERTGYSWWCAKPKEQIRNRFDLDREVLCIYCPRPDVDARVFKYIRDALETRGLRDRVDQVLVLLIHGADSAKVSEFVRGHDDWVIVPFSKRGLLNSQRGPMYVRQRLADYAGSQNLFAFSGPVKADAYFFGRDALVHTLFKRASAEGESSGLFGLRKTGKTSVLYAIRRRSSGSRSLFCYVDCQTPGVHALRWWDFLAELAARFDRELEAQGVVDRPQLPRITNERDAGRAFGEYVRGVLRRCKCDSLTFMLDEIENIMPGATNRLSSHWDQDAVALWQTIRGLNQETEGLLTFIVAGVNPACVSEPTMGGQINPIFQLVKPYYLEPMDSQQIRTMVRTIARYSGATVDEAVYPFLRARYGGHPFLVRLACGEVWETLNRSSVQTRPQMAVANFERLKTQIAKSLEKPIRDILLSLALWYSSEYELLCMLAQGAKEFVLEWAEQEPTRLLQFGEFGLVNPQTGDFLIEDIREFLTVHGDEYRLQVESMARSDVPPELLPETPDLELVARLHTMQVDIEVRLRRVILNVLYIAKKFDEKAVVAALSAGMSKNTKWKDARSQFVGRKPRDVMNELFMLDLSNIVSENWSDFGGLFGSDKKRFDGMAGLANVARRIPSHTKVVGKEEAASLEAATRWLGGYLAKADALLSPPGTEALQPG